MSVCNAGKAAAQQSPLNTAVYKECLPNRKKPAPPSMECTTAQATLDNSTLTVCTETVGGEPKIHWHEIRVVMVSVSALYDVCLRFDFQPVYSSVPAMNFLNKYNFFASKYCMIRTVFRLTPEYTK